MIILIFQIFFWKFVEIISGLQIDFHFFYGLVPLLY